MLLLSVIIRSSTRLRLEFSSVVDSTAFTGTGDITIESLDSLGLSPTIQQRIIVASSPKSIELVLSVPLVDGGSYLVSVDSIPSTDLSTATGTQKIRPGIGYVSVNTEFETPDVEKALFAVDLVWTGTDYLVTPDGDLSTIDGMANVHGALTRRLVSDGLTWDNAYGGKPRLFIDGPTPALQYLRGDILRQMLSDNRVKSSTVKLVLDTDNVEEASYEVEVQLVGSSNKSDISIQVPKT